MAKLISTLNIGDKVRFGKHQVNTEAKQDIIWKVAGKNHDSAPANSITLVTKDIIDMRGFDAIEPNNADAHRKTRGNNRYKDSNLRQWLNKAGNPWFVKTHTHDEPPTDAGTNNHGTNYDNRDGFLSAFTDEELAAILDTELTVAKNTVTDGGGTEKVTDKLFLLSNTEVGLENEPGGAEGSKLPLFTNDASRIANVSKQAEDHSNYDKAGTWYWWLRSPYSSHSLSVRNVHTTGTLYSHDASNGNGGVRPALNLVSDILISDGVDSDGCYTLKWSQPYVLTLDKSINIKSGDTLDKVKLDAKVNSTPLSVKQMDKEKITYRADNLATDKVDLEINGTDAEISSLAYVID